MNTEEEFYLGDNVDDFDFYLGDSIEDVEEDKKDVTEIDASYKELLDVYELLKIQEKPYEVGYEEYFKDNPEIFKFAGVQYFKPLSSEEYENFEKKCERLIAIAHKKWIVIDTQKKLEEFESALNTLKRIFKYEGKTKKYVDEIRRTLRKHLNTALNQKIKDGILEISEILEIVEIAISIRFIDDTVLGRKAIVSKIEEANTNGRFKIETFEETFVRNVSKKEKIERIDTDTIRDELFKEYLELAEISNKVYDKQPLSESKMREDMFSLLSKNELLISNIDLFQIEFLDKEIQKKGEFYFSVPLNSSYYYYLKGTAENKYELTEDQWRQITLIRNIRNESDSTVAFIMGYKKEASVPGIIKLFEDNPTVATDRILAGDLETYFSHIGRKNISNKILELKEKYKNSKNEIVFHVINYLKLEIGEKGLDIVEKKEQTETLDKLITDNANFKDFVAFVLKNKVDESLIDEITTDTKTLNDLNDYFFSKKNKTYLNFLFNIMHELLNESDILQYKYSFIKVAKKIQDELLLNKDCFSFFNLYEPLIEVALQSEIFPSKEEISDFDMVYQEMEELYKEKTKVKESNQNLKKPKFSLFSKGVK